MKEPIYIDYLVAYIACDEDETLHLFTREPAKDWHEWYSNGEGHVFDIDEDTCAKLGVEVPSWEDDEPKEVMIDIHISKHND